MIFFVFPLQIKPLFFRFSSVVAPSLLHRLSIETMDYRWIIDGLSMDYLRRKSEVRGLNLRLFIHIVWDIEKLFVFFPLLYQIYFVLLPKQS
jgi:hypothetical protein